MTTHVKEFSLPTYKRTIHIVNDELEVNSGRSLWKMGKPRYLPK